MKKIAALNQIRLQEKAQSLGINIVSCGSCGTVLLHEVNNEKIDCTCGETMWLGDCPDLWYKGVEENFNSSKFYSIAGRWVDDGTEFENYILKESCVMIESEDHKIFKYGWSESDIIREMNCPSEKSEIIITNYKEIDLP